MGTPDFAVPGLLALVKSSHEVVCVVTTQDKPAGRGLRLQTSAVKRAALEASCPVLQPDNLRDDGFLLGLKSYQPDLMVVVAFRILPSEVFTIPPRGTLNLHASLLPKYRGAAPIQWALINGEKETGVTTFFIEEKVDTGRVIMQRRIAIDPEMNAGELHDALAAAGAEVLLETVDAISAGICRTAEQQGEATLAPKITRELCRIDWERPAVDIHNLVRALAPVPGAVTRWRNTILKILASRLAAGSGTGEPGRILAAAKDGAMHVQTGRGVLSIYRIQPEGKRPMLAGEYLAGHRALLGDHFIF